MYQIPRPLYDSCIFSFKRCKKGIHRHTSPSLFQIIINNNEITISIFTMPNGIH